MKWKLFLYYNHGKLDNVFIIIYLIEKLFQTWYAAVVQCFFSLAVGSGPIIMFSSYNPFKHNIYR